MNAHATKLPKTEEDFLQPLLDACRRNNGRYEVQDPGTFRKILDCGAHHGIRNRFLEDEKRHKNQATLTRDGGTFCFELFSVDPI